MVVTRIATLCRRITPSQLMALHRDQSGMFAISHLATTMFLTATIICALNMGGAMVDRTRQQRKADAAAQTLGTWKARNMNAVVAHQHLMGELLSLAMIHHAIGGDNLDDNRVSDTSNLDSQLTIAYYAALANQRYRPFAYRDVVSKVRADGALIKSHRRLKKLLTYVYYTKGVSAALMAFPPTRPIGEALGFIADQIESAIHREWKVLEQIRKNAVALVPLKKNILRQQLPSAKRQLDQMVRDYPKNQRQLADLLEDELSVKIHILPTDRRLPIKIDPLAGRSSVPAGWRRPTDCDCPSVAADNMKEQVHKVTQLSRATFPWVNYHRKNLVTSMKWTLLLSGMGDHYFDETGGVAKRMAVDLQSNRGSSLALYVLDDFRAPDKGYEEWTRPGGEGVADRSFGITVLVGNRARTPMGPVVFRRQPEPIAYRFSSAFVWNRFEPVKPKHRIDFYCKRIVPSVQAKTGWDTLNWSQDTRASELVGIGIPHVFPKIEPVWNSQLSVTSPARIQQLQQQTLPDWARGVTNLLPDSIDASLVGI
jgi:hypothetical protein